MRAIICAGLLLSLTSCMRWKGNGTDEVLPDVAGMTTGVRKWFGVPSQATPHERADENVIHNRLPEPETFEKAEPAHESGAAAPQKGNAESAKKPLPR